MVHAEQRNAQAEEKLKQKELTEMYYEKNLERMSKKTAKMSGKAAREEFLVITYTLIGNREKNERILAIGTRTLPSL